MSSRLKLVGAAMVVLAFFLPWFTINPAAELQRLAGKLQQGMAQGLPQFREQPASLPGSFQALSVNITGGDIQHGLGWVILALAIVVAALPFVNEGTETRLERNLSVIGLIIGSIVLLYLARDAFRNINIGFILALAGYAVMFVGALKRKSVRNY